MFPFCLIIPFLYISNCSRLVYCCPIIIHLLNIGLVIWVCFCSASVCFKFLKIMGFFAYSQEILGDSPSWFVCSWHVCARYLAVWVSKWSLNRKQCCAVLSKMWPRFVRCCPGGGAPDWPTAITVGGDELHLQPPAVLLLSRKVLCWAC